MVKQPETEELAALPGDTDFISSACGTKQLLRHRKCEMRFLYSRQTVKCKFILIADLIDNNKNGTIKKPAPKHRGLVSPILLIAYHIAPTGQQLQHVQVCAEANSSQKQRSWERKFRVGQWKLWRIRYCWQSF